MSVKKVYALKGNSMKLDGGAMFGNAPKALWSKWMKPDEQNRIEIGSQSLLIVTDRYKILFETGVGAYLSPEMKKRYHVVEDHHVLLKSLNDFGVGHEDITHIILSHLHFDHAGGLLKEWESNDQMISLLFPNAQMYVGELNFQRAVLPHLRDKASFIEELPQLLEESNHLHLVNGNDRLKLDGIDILFMESHGHTPGMILSYIKGLKHPILFAGDIAPGHAWINLPITMGYDRFPEQLIEEKQEILHRFHKENPWIFYTHDVEYVSSRLTFDESKNRFKPIDLVNDLAFFNQD